MVDFGQIGLLRRPWVGADAMGGGYAQRNITKPHDPADFHVRACKCAIVEGLEICVLCALDNDYNTAAGLCWMSCA